MSVITNQHKKETKINYSDPSNRNMILECQLKMLIAYGPQLGIYILPHLHQETWEGIIFVRQGFYKQGKFRFCIELEGFPVKQPRIFFKTKMYHPLVNYKTGELDISAVLYEPWNCNDQSLFYNLMNEFQNIFVDQEKLENKVSFNPQAAVLLQQNERDFLMKTMQCVQLSNDSLNDYWQGSALNTVEIDQDEKDQLMYKLANVKGLSLKRQQKVKVLIQSLLF